MIEIPKGKNLKEKNKQFVSDLIAINNQVGIKMSARGWGYYLEGLGQITKKDINTVGDRINDYIKEGLLPIDFTAEEEARQFSGVETPDDRTEAEAIKQQLNSVLECDNYYSIDWWDDEKYYLQMLVEKIDLKNLFYPICSMMHIPIATSKGWGSIRQRGIYSLRFKEAEEKGLKCVLLYCGDHDPDGLRIAKGITSNLQDLKHTYWMDGRTGYDPKNLIIDRFGLDAKFINENNLVWINNLETGSGGYLAKEVDGRIVSGKTKGGEPHKNFLLPYVQDYIKMYGVRKCEANAIMSNMKMGQWLCMQAIWKHLGEDAGNRFENKKAELKASMKRIRDKTGITTHLDEILKHPIFQEKNGEE